MRKSHEQENNLPNLQKPVNRVPTGQLPSALAELEEAPLLSAIVPMMKTTSSRH